MTDLEARLRAVPPKCELCFKIKCSCGGQCYGVDWTALAALVREMIKEKDAAYQHEHWKHVQNAEEVDRLRVTLAEQAREIERLREALKIIAKMHVTQDGSLGGEIRARRQIAEVALRPLGVVDEG
jgi:hypothetical protein